MTVNVPSVLWCCWWVAGRASGLWKTEWWDAGMVICLGQGADLHMAQLMPLPLTISCFSKTQIGFTFLVPAHPGNPGQSPEGCKTDVCVWLWSVTVCHDCNQSQRSVFRWNEVIWGEVRLGEVRSFVVWKLLDSSSIDHHSLNVCYIVCRLVWLKQQFIFTDIIIL